MIKNDLVQIVIPIYKEVPDDFEKISLHQCFKIFDQRYVISFIKPFSLSIEWYDKNFSGFHTECFDDHYFKDLKGYNELMLSDKFYSRFLHSKYILIYQTDAYVFRDDLISWCNKGYDYIGAPWLPKQKYRSPGYRLFLKIKSFLLFALNRNDPSSLFYKVGNGGFSLRNTRKFLDITLSETELIRHYLHNCHKDIYNEDVFWAIESNRNKDRLKIPSYTEALMFAFDKSPNEAYEANHKQLPFGCHGWSKEKMLPFWQKIISA